MSAYTVEFEMKKTLVQNLDQEDENIQQGYQQVSIINTIYIKHVNSK